MEGLFVWLKEDSVLSLNIRECLLYGVLCWLGRGLRAARFGVVVFGAFRVQVWHPGLHLGIQHAGVWKEEPKTETLRKL